MGMFEFDLGYPVQLERNPNYGPRPYVPDGERGEYRMKDTDWEFDTSRYQRHLNFEPGHAFGQWGNGASGNYGVRPVQMRFLVHAPGKGTALFLLSTGWVPKRDDSLVWPQPMHSAPMGFDLSYHALAPQYEGQEAANCEYTPNGRCYYDGTGLGGDALLWQFLMTGDERVIWRALVDRAESLNGPDAIASATPAIEGEES